MVFKLLSRKPVVITLHGRDITYNNRLYQFIIPRCLKRLNKVICVSHAIEEAAITRGIDTQKTVVITNGISDEFYLDSDKKNFRNELASELKRDLYKSKILLIAGRFVEKKGIHWFVEEVVPKLSDNSLMYVIAGSGILEPVIRESIEKHKLQDNVFLVGWADDDILKLLYNAADIFVMPNIHIEGDMEGFGLVAPEAASCGLPVVAADVEGIKNAIANGENGFLVESGNPQAFIDKIRELLSNEKERRAFGERARRYTLENYGWDKVANEYAEIFNS
jgi:glycosyltransferase involved in cell wall biosynthesis